MPHQILLIATESPDRETLVERLAEEGYLVQTTADGEEGFNLALDGDHNLVILDVVLPGKNGFDFCRDLRQLGINTPLLILSHRSSTVDKVLGLKMGADDYVTKPFKMQELLARIEAVLRRNPAPARQLVSSYRFGSVRVDLRRAEVLRDGCAVALSAKEFHLLRYLLEHRGELLSRAQLLKEVWGYTPELESRTVDVHVACLRQKLEPNPKYPQWILTVRRLGYRFAG